MAAAPFTKTPLLLALEHADLQTARVLVDRGADVNAGTWDNRYVPLNVAVRKLDVEAVRLLLAHGAEPEPGAPNRPVRSPLAQAIQQLNALREEPSSREHARQRVEIERCRLIIKLLQWA